MRLITSSLISLSTVLSQANNNPLTGQSWSVSLTCPIPDASYIFQQIISPSQTEGADAILKTLATCPDLKEQTYDTKLEAHLLFQSIGQTLTPAEKLAAQSILPIYIAECKDYTPTDFLLLVRLAAKLNPEAMLGGVYFVNWFCKAEDDEISRTFKISRSYDFKIPTSAIPAGLDCTSRTDLVPLESPGNPGVLENFRQSVENMLCTVQQVASNSPQCSIQASDIKCGSLKFKAEISSEVTPLTMFKFLLALDQVIPYLKQVVKTELINYGATVGNVQIEVTENQAKFASDSSCATHNCQNGGICREMDNNYYCDCANTGFKGELCASVDDARNCKTVSSDVSKCDVCNDGFDLVSGECSVCQSGFFMELDLATSVYKCIDITTNCDKYYHKSSVLVNGQCTDPCQPKPAVSILNKYAELVSASKISSDLVFAGQTGDLPAEL